jgi:hypothetical protein
MDYWNDLQIIANTFDRTSAPAVEKVAEISGYPNNEWRGWLIPAFTFAPDPIDAGKIRLRSPYSNPKKISNLLTKQCLNGSLTESDGGYRLSPRAMKTAQKMLDASREALIDQVAYPKQSLNQISQYLQTIYNACLKSTEPQSKWCILHNRDQIQLDFQPAVIQIDQICSDLAAWRDDCHLGAWQPYHYIQGSVWEVLSLMWKSNLHTLAEISEQLCDLRGYTELDYLNALKDLKMRGWVFEESGHYFLTKSGSTIRQLAEDFTDELFYAPFYVLSEDEQEELRNLLSDFCSQISSGSD